MMAVFLHDPDQQHDADQRDHAQFLAADQQREDSARRRAEERGQ